MYTLQGGLLAEDEGEGRGLLREEVLDAARARSAGGAAAVEEPQDLGVAVQLQVLQGKRKKRGGECFVQEVLVP